jgi:uncharacterized protein YndB with AHSA1/START domain
MPVFEREVEIDAPVETVWNALTNPRLWEQWFPGIDSVSGVSSLQQGADFTWTSEGKSGRGRVVRMEPMQRLEIVTQLGDDQDKHTFQLRSSGGFLGLSDDETKIEYSLDTMMGGGILGGFIAGGNPRDALRVKKAMNLFRRVVETGAG